jgi:hypothetical protein
LLLVVTCVGALGCGTEGPPEGPPPAAEQSNQTVQTTSTPPPGVQSIFTDPGEVVAKIPAGSAIPEIQTWEVHSKPEGVSAVGIGASTGEPKVIVVVALTDDGKDTWPTAWGFAQSPDLHYSVKEVAEGVNADIAAAGGLGPSLTATSLRPMNSDPLYRAGSAPLVQCTTGQRATYGLSVLGGGTGTIGGIIFSFLCGWPGVLLCLTGTAAAAGGGIWGGKKLSNCPGTLPPYG